LIIAHAANFRGASSISLRSNDFIRTMMPSSTKLCQTS
jgi:hypothetical protein